MTRGLTPLLQGNADQGLTEDIAKFCQHLSHLYPQISKPILDIVLMTAQLVWLAKSTIQAGSGNPIVEASSIALCAVYFTNQVCVVRRVTCSSLPCDL